MLKSFDLELHGEWSEFTDECIDLWLLSPVECRSCRKAGRSQSVGATPACSSQVVFCEQFRHFFPLALRHEVMYCYL